MTLLSRAQIDRQPFYRPDEIRDAFECRLTSSCPGPGLQTLPNNIGLRDIAFPRLSVNLRDERLGQPYRKRLHGSSVLHE